MPSKNSIKIYKENGFYHVYNRGVEKRNVFLSHTDYLKFLHWLRQAAEKNSIKVHCYCLMSNHYHLLISQTDRKDITKLMHSLSSIYTVYFNIKYQRVGSLFQGTYKARLIKTDEDLLNVSAYIHNNPSKDKPGLNLKKYPYSSYHDYVRKTKNTWLSIEEITKHFVINDYKKYLVEKFNHEEKLG